jgi:WxcM-like, C-terminal
MSLRFPHHKTATHDTNAILGQGAQFGMTDYFGGKAKLINLSKTADARGTLVPFYFEQMPFTPKRAFVVNNVPAGTIRGGHALRVGAQMLVCTHGRIDVLMRYGTAEASVVMTTDAAGLLLHSGVWSQQTYVTEGSSLLVFASTPFDPADYIQ